MADMPIFPHSSPDELQRAVQQVAGQEQDAGATGDTKFTKDEVNYRDAGSSNTRCERCANYSWAKGGGGTGTCRVVLGLIKPGAVCDRFTPGGTTVRDLITGEPTR